MSRMTKPFMAAIAALLLAAPFSYAGGSSDSKTGGLSLQDAIEQSAEKIAGELPRGSRVAIVAFKSVNDNLSDYIMEELTGALFDRGIEVADRQNLAYVYQELNFQMSGDVSDETAKSIGKFLAADMVITGDLTDLDSLYRYRTSAINVETAVRASVTRLNVRADDAMRRMVTALANQQSTVRAAKYGVSEDKTPQTAGTFLDRGIMYASRGEYGKAIADFTEAIRLNPNMGAAYMLRARALFASVSYVTEVGDDFSGVSTSSTIGERSSLEQMRVFERVVADFTRAISLDPYNPRTYAERGLVYSDKGDFNQAIADFNQAIRLDPHYAVAYNNRGYVYLIMSDYISAIADFSQAIMLYPNFSGAYANRGVAYIYRRDYDRAIFDFNQAIQLDPNNAHAYANRGVTYYNRRDYDRAILDLNRAIQLDPNNASTYINRGNAYGEKRDYNRAIADYEAALRLDPNSTDARTYIERIRRQRGY